MASGPSLGCGRASRRARASRVRSASGARPTGGVVRSMGLAKSAASDATVGQQWERSESTRGGLGGPRGRGAGRGERRRAGAEGLCFSMSEETLEARRKASCRAEPCGCEVCADDCAWAEREGESGGERGPRLECEDGVDAASGVGFGEQVAPPQRLPPYGSTAEGERAGGPGTAALPPAFSDMLRTVKRLRTVKQLRTDAGLVSTIYHSLALKHKGGRKELSSLFNDEGMRMQSIKAASKQRR
ncbi:hypothetical protein AB1Y20_010398 [Prymnesium parvum]|uniref:Uncharacterized protein n=1 Tax=Prymnesium parvum TaxID=97485 RepID=A0AB34IP61_PRYPA